MVEWIYGKNPVYETIKAGRRDIHRLWVAQGAQEKGRLADILALCKQKNIRVEHAPRQKLDSMVNSHQGVILETSEYDYVGLQDILDCAHSRGEPAFILILDALQDPQNLGTLLRTAEATGVHGVLIPLRHTVNITPAVVNASSGACEHLLVAQVNLAQAIRSLKKESVWVVGLDHALSAHLPGQIHLDGAIALVVGNEGQGMRSLVRDSCDYLLKLPMRGQIESLNAAVAGSVALYLVWQARGFGLVNGS